MSRLYSVNGFYGSNHIACEVFVYECRGQYWYCVEDSQNVNSTYDLIDSGVDVETVMDNDCFTASKPVESLEDLEREVDN